jgi:hypothetical protein
MSAPSRSWPPCEKKLPKTEGVRRRATRSDPLGFLVRARPAGERRKNLATRVCGGSGEG